MAHRFSKTRAGWLAVVVGLMLTACSAAPQAVPPSPTPSPSPALTAYHTPTVTPTPSGQPPTATPLPTATATIFKYTLQKDDEMFGLALRFGVSVSAIKTANPSVHPNYMGAGMVLIIPITPTPPTPTKTPAGTPSPAAAAIRLTAPSCYLDAQGGLWCLALARNPGPARLESPSAVFRLAASGAGSPAEQTVYAPLNVLAGGAALPIAAYFPPPLAGRPKVEVVPGDSLPLADGDPRYPAVETQGLATQVDGLSGTIKGEVALGKGASAAKQVWVLAVAYDAAGNPVGLRKWESPGGLSAGSPLAFNLTVYSLGPLIARVDVLAEGHSE
jgi:hypothetical protein